jgi:hypothetical protein
MPIHKFSLHGYNFVFLTENCSTLSFADSAIWKNVFDYEDKYIVDKGDISFVFANTANITAYNKKS